MASSLSLCPPSCNHQTGNRQTGRCKLSGNGGKNKNFKRIVQSKICKSCFPMRGQPNGQKEKKQLFSSLSNQAFGWSVIFWNLEPF